MHRVARLLLLLTIFIASGAGRASEASPPQSIDDILACVRKNGPEHSMRQRLVLKVHDRAGDVQTLKGHYASTELALKPLRDKIAKHEQELAAIPAPATPIMRELPPERRRKSHVFDRGNWLVEGEEVEPGVPPSMPPLGADARRTRTRHLRLAPRRPGPDEPYRAHQHGAPFRS